MYSLINRKDFFMENTLYYNSYKFIFKEKTTGKLKTNIYEYTSNIFLDEIEIYDDSLEFVLYEKEIEILYNKEKLRFPQNLIPRIFSTLVLYFYAKVGYCKVLNIENILYRLSIIEVACIDNHKLLNEIKEYKKIIEVEENLFAFINETEIIKLLFRFPYFIDKNKILIKKEFYLKTLIDKISIPLILDSSTNGNKVFITGKINTLKLGNFIILEKLEKIYGIKIEEYQLTFNYKIIFGEINNKIEKINNNITLKINATERILKEITIFKN